MKQALVFKAPPLLRSETFLNEFWEGLKLISLTPELLHSHQEPAISLAAFENNQSCSSACVAVAFFELKKKIAQINLSGSIIPVTLLFG